MRRTLRTLAVVATACTTLAATTAPTLVARLHGTMSGAWTGTLRYRDYRDSTKFVTLPTLLDGVAARDSSSVRLDFTYDDGPGKTVRESDRFALAADGHTLTWGTAADPAKQSTYAITSLADAATIRFVAERDGTDNDRPARIRETVTASRTELRILKEVRFAPGADWLFRHEYEFRRR